MSWKFLVVLAAAVSAASAGLSVNSCVLQSDTAVKQFKLSTLNRMFGDLLATESNGNIYIVSICRPVPQIYYDPRQLAGSIKITAEGYTIDLGRIDQTNVVVNENTIVLTYVGGEPDRNPRDTCKGLKWSTYLTFICDSFSTKDTLTLIDEDPDQPEICQIWFEIKTSKTCNRQPDVPLAILEKDLMKETKQNYDEKHTETSHNSSSLPIVISSYNTKHIKHQNNEEKSSDLTQTDEKILTDNVHEDKFKNNESESKLSRNIKDFSDINHVHLYDHQTNINKKPSESENKKISENIKYENEVSEDRNRIFGQENEPLNHYNTNSKQIPSNSGYKETYQNINSELSRNEYFDKVHTPLNNYNMNSNKISPNSEYKNNYQNTNPEQMQFKNGNEKAGRENIPLNHSNKKITKIPSDTEYIQDYKNIHTDKQFRNDQESSIKSNQPLNHDSTSSNKVTSGSEHKHNSKNTQYENESLIKNNQPLSHDITNSNKIPSDSEHIQNSENINTDKQLKNDPESSVNNNEPLNHDSASSNKITSDSENKHNSENNQQENESSIKNNQPMNHDSTNSNKITSVSEHKQNSENIHYGNEISVKKNQPSIHDNTNNSKIPSDIEHIQDSKNIHTDTQLKNDHESSIKSNKPLNHDSTSNIKVTSGSEHKHNSENTQYENESSIKNNQPLSHDITNSNEIPSDSEHIQNSENINTDKQLKNDPESSVNNNEPLNHDSASSNKIISDSENKQNSENNQQENESSIKNNQPSNHDSTNSNKIPLDTEHIQESKNIYTDKQFSNEHESSVKKNESLNHNSASSNKITSNSENKQNPENNQQENGSSIKNNQPSNNDSTNSNKISSDSEHIQNSENINTDKKLKNDPESSVNNNEPLNHDSASSQKIPSDGKKINKSTEKSSKESINFNYKTDTLKHNSSYVNPINNANKITQNDQSVTETNHISIASDKNTNFSNDNRNDDQTITATTNQSNASISSDNFFSKLFPKGINLSSTQIIAGLSSLLVAFGAIGTAVNRYYYKLSGFDQIPLKETFQTIFNFIQIYIIQKLCCCCGKDLESGEITNEKTPLLLPKNAPTPTVEDETSKYKKKKINSDESNQQQNENADNEESSEKNTKNGYGSVSNESNSQSSTKKYRKKKRKFKSSDNSSNDSGSENQYNNEVKFIKDELNDLHRKSIKEIISKKFNTIVDKKVKPVFENIFKKSAGDNESKYEVQNKKGSLKKDNIESKSTFQSIFGEAVQEIDKDAEQKKENSVKNNTNVEIKPSVNNVDVIEEKKKLNTSEPKQNILNVPKDSTESKLTDISSINNESKLQFLGLNAENEKDTEKSEKYSAVESSESEIKTDKDEDDVEVIEEIVFVDAEGEEGEEEVVEEVTETTTTIEDPEDEFDVTGTPHPSHTVTTVRKTSVRKISSSSLPGDEEENVTETVEVFTSTPESEKKPFGFELGIGKSGVNVTVGEKKLGIGKSGMKLSKREESPPNGRQPEEMNIKLDKSGLRLNHGKQREKNDEKGANGDPDKNKTRSLSVPNFKMFKRSTSHPASNSDVREVVDVTTPEVPSKKVSRSTSSLLKFGKSRSKSTGVTAVEADVTIDPKVMHSFLDHERKTSHLQQLQEDVNGAQLVDDVPAKIIAAAENVTSSLVQTAKDSSLSPPDLKSTAKAVEKDLFKTIGSLAGASIGATGIVSATANKNDDGKRKPAKDSVKKSTKKTKRGMNDKLSPF